MPRAKTKSKSKAKSKVKTKTKTLKASLLTAQQIKKECNAALNDAFKEAQVICQESLVAAQSYAKKYNEQLKKMKAHIKELHQKIRDTENALASKATKALQNRLKTHNSKLKDSNRELASLEKAAAKLKAQLQEIKDIKANEKAKAAAIKKWVPAAKPKPAAAEKHAQPKKKAASKKQAAPQAHAEESDAAPAQQQMAPEQPEAAAALSVAEQLTASAIKVGEMLPEITALTHDNERVPLSSFRGKNVVLYFYPRDNTPGCTKEAIDFTDNSEQFDQHDAVVIGVSRDSVASHQKFIEEHGIGCTLLSDPDEELCKAFDVIRTKNKYGKMVTGIERSTFVIDKEGVIRAIFRNVKVPGHVDKVLAAVREL